MRAKPSSANFTTSTVAITRAFWLLLAGLLPRSKRSDSNALRSAIILLLTLLAFSLTPASPSYAATLTVCASGCNSTTIAGAIVAASAGDTISILDAVRTEANITVNKNLTIQGQGAANTAVDGNAAGSVFIINNGVTATIQDMTIRNGSSITYGYGGGIYNLGTLTLSNSTLTGNAADAGGGGIFNYTGTLTLSNSTFTGNSASGVLYTFGGAIFNRGGAITIGSSTLSDNSASGYYGGGGDGGGIYNGGALTI